MQGLSTIITFYNGLSSLKMCINLLQDALKAEDIYEIIVVNDNPTMNINFLEDEYSVQVLNMPENKGYAAACNYAVDHARYDTLLFMDCDIYPTGNWLQNMKKTYADIGENGAVNVWQSMPSAIAAAVADGDFSAVDQKIITRNV